MSDASTAPTGPSDGLRPIERRMADMRAAGVNEVEIAWRFRRSPRYVRQVMSLSEQPRRRRLDTTDRHGLRPIERRVRWWRSQGVGFDELAPRFRRTPRFLEQVDTLASYKLRSGR